MAQKRKVIQKGKTFKGCLLVANSTPFFILGGGDFPCAISRELETFRVDCLSPVF